MRQYWDILGLDEDASAEDLRSRYRQLVKEWHPDKYASNDRYRAAAEVRLKLINEAYRVLKPACCHRRSDDGAQSTSTPPSFRGAEHAASGSAGRSPWGWLETELILTYLPLVIIVLTVAQQKFEFLLPAIHAVAVFLVLAWSMMAWTVSHNNALSVQSRIIWVAIMILFAGVAVPIYFARHIRASTA
jgi:hypothetical protein